MVVASFLAKNNFEYRNNCSKENVNTSKPSEHPPSQGETLSKRLLSELALC